MAQKVTGSYLVSDTTRDQIFTGDDAIVRTSSSYPGSTWYSNQINKAALLKLINDNNQDLDGSGRKGSLILKPKGTFLQHAFPVLLSPIRLASDDQNGSFVSQIGDQAFKGKGTIAILAVYIDASGFPVPSTYPNDYFAVNANKSVQQTILYEPVHDYANVSREAELILPSIGRDGTKQLVPDIIYKSGQLFVQNNQTLQVTSVLRANGLYYQFSTDTMYLWNGQQNFTMTSNPLTSSIASFILPNAEYKGESPFSLAAHAYILPVTAAQLRQNINIYYQGVNSFDSSKKVRFLKASDAGLSLLLFAHVIDDNRPFGAFYALHWRPSTKNGAAGIPSAIYDIDTGGPSPFRWKVCDTALLTQAVSYPMGNFSLFSYNISQVGAQNQAGAVAPVIFDLKTSLMASGSSVLLSFGSASTIHYRTRDNMTELNSQIMLVCLPTSITSIKAFYNAPLEYTLSGLVPMIQSGSNRCYSRFAAFAQRPDESLSVNRAKILRALCGGGIDINDSNIYNNNNKLVSFKGTIYSKTVSFWFIEASIMEKDQRSLLFDHWGDPVEVFLESSFVMCSEIVNLFDTASF